MSAIEVLDRLLAIVSQALKYLAAALLVGVSILICADVVMRFILNSPILGVAEIVANGIVIIAFLQLTYAVRQNSMLKSELILNLMGEKGKLASDTINALLGALLFGLVAWASWHPLVRSITTGEFVGYSSFQLPVWPVRLVIESCSILAIIAYLIHAIKAGIFGIRTDEVSAAH
ncbi:TRAP transporter small permease subunit [Aquamicrobium zhengzhouense]|uniref:TRAP transporter small permease protein n=1 Tax=Aquamicrobium zhengzhouense TaxID=2781738 RepID=A0ABS0SA93_9HYPH|nr:TRAP transporter small permease [Aquamicrobium zhengzhouense]MBI1620208.1 TRAP transporter small permease [Aquamicrobium zhengzhouense]